MPGFHSKSSQACDAKLFSFIVSSKGANDYQLLLQVNINKQDGQAEIGPKGENPMDLEVWLPGDKRFVSGLAPWKAAVGKAENSFVSTFGSRLAVQLEVALPSPAVVPAAESCLRSFRSRCTVLQFPKQKGQNQSSLLSPEPLWTIYCENQHQQAGGE